MNEMVERILELKKEKDVVILAHYYVTGDIQDIADYVGDSYPVSYTHLDVYKRQIWGSRRPILMELAEEKT